MTGALGDHPAEPAPAPVFDPRRFRRGATARGHAFGLLATLALVLPAEAGLDWASWRGCDGGIAIVVALALVTFSWPSPIGPGRASLAHAALAAASALSATAAFVALAIVTAPRGVTAAEFGVVAAVLSGTTLLGRRGGALIAVFALTAVAAGAFLSGQLGVDPRIEVGAEVGRAPEGDDASWRPADVARVRLELTGPLTSAVVSADALAPLIVTANLGPGEALVTDAWIAAPRDRGEFGAEFTVSALEPAGTAGERVRVALAEGDGDSSGIDDRLAGRPRPPLPRGARPAPPLESIFSAWAVLFVITSVGGRLGTTRPALGIPFCLLAGGAGAALCVWVAGAVTPPDEAARGTPLTAVRVLEGATGADGASVWLQVDRAREVLVLEAPALAASGGRLSVADGRPRRTRLDARGPKPVATVEAGPGVAVELVRPLEPGLRLLRPDVNTWGPLEATWQRTADGTWTAHGPWALGEALAAETPSDEPPAWSVLGLPVGAPAYVGRIDPAGFVGLGAAGPALGARDTAAAPRAGTPAVVWIRTIGP